MAEKHNPGQPGLGGQMPNPYPPQYGASNGPVAQPPPSLQQATVAPHQTLQHVQEAPVLPLQMTPCESEERSDTDYHIYKLAPHVEIAFGDTFKESDTARGFKFMKDVNQSIYEYTHFAVYAGLTVVIAPLMTFMWGIIFALTHIVLIWMIQPVIKFNFIWFRIMSMIFSASVRLFLDPCFKSASLVFSAIKGRFQMDESDITLNVKTSQIQHV